MNLQLQQIASAIATARSGETTLDVEAYPLTGTGNSQTAAASIGSSSARRPQSGSLQSGSLQSGSLQSGSPQSGRPEPRVASSSPVDSSCSFNIGSTPLSPTSTPPSPNLSQSSPRPPQDSPSPYSPGSAAGRYLGIDFPNFGRMPQGRSTHPTPPRPQKQYVTPGDRQRSPRQDAAFSPDATYSPSVPPFPVLDTKGEPSLPKSKQLRFSSHRYSTNPALAMGLLEDIGRVIGEWQGELQTIHTHIHGLYQEGAIIDGWLETDHSPQGDARGYRLCGLDADGQVWRRPCQPEQLPMISVAIARYQKLRQLIGRKKNLEIRLQRLAQTLAILRGRLRAG